MRTIDYFDKVAELHPDRDALVDAENTYTYRQVRELSGGIARAMGAAGIASQQPVAIYAPNHASVLLCLLGLWRAGAVWTPVNARNAIDANAAYLTYAGTGWLFYHSSYAKDATRLAAAVPQLKHLVCLDQPNNGHQSLEQFVSSAEGTADIDWGDPFGNLDDLVGIFPTGGTTGSAKGVRVTNLGWGTMLETAMGAWYREGLRPVCLATAPLTHAAGPVSIAAMALGATIVIMSGFDALGVMEHIQRYRVTHMFLPPTALYALLAHPRVREFDYSSLRIFLLAGSPVSPEKLKLAVEIFGPCMCQSYGQTEAPMLATWLPPEIVAAAAAGEHPERLKSCGRATSAVRVAIMDDDGTLLPPGATGEIVIRGALVSHSYHELPAATAEVRRHGWHHTGDVGYRDQDGFFFIVDRKKDMIITGGFNVFSAEVEAAVMELPEVRECAVVGVPDERWGEAVTAIVALHDDESLTEAEIIAHCRTKLGAVKAPKAVHFVAEVPRTVAGKFDKKAIRAKFWGGAERNVN